MSRPKSIGRQLEELARSILEVALRDQTPLPDKLDAFKVVTTYHIGISKAAKNLPSDDSAGGSFDALKTGLRTVGGKDA
jgi:hypothetical protein